jgi:hypothetical protein
MKSPVLAVASVWSRTQAVASMSQRRYTVTAQQAAANTAVASHRLDIKIPLPIRNRAPTGPKIGGRPIEEQTEGN